MLPHTPHSLHMQAGALLLAATALGAPRVRAVAARAPRLDRPLGATHCLPTPARSTVDLLADGSAVARLHPLDCVTLSDFTQLGTHMQMRGQARSSAGSAAEGQGKAGGT